jgi:aspartyl-tRNA(Asn)/glutamyl-tRNA(Gln) amidotransferase subunit A
VAADFAPVAIGSDTGGSIRQPAAFCGITGLKPTYGRVSRFGLIAFGSSLDQIGPMTRTAEDCALVLSVIGGHDAHDSTSSHQDNVDFRADLEQPIKGLRIGLCREHFDDGLNSEVEARVLAAVDQLKQLGAQIVETHLPQTKYAVPAYYVIAPCEASSNLARFDGVRYTMREPGENLEQMYCRTRAEGFGEEVKRRIMLGTYALSSGYYDAYYLKASKVRRLIKQDYDHAFADCDLILGPTTPTAAFRLGEHTANPLEMYLADIYTVSANLAGLPAISLPCGFSSDGLPIGLQLQSPAFAEVPLLRVAHQYQQQTDWHLRRPAGPESF